MAEYSVNAEQYAAIDISSNIAVPAGAGSGKTRVLTQRYLRLLKEAPAAAIDNIVAITFTEKAALEMKERVRQLVAEELKNAQDAKSIAQWKQIRDQLAAAHISTIHGFCSGMLREYYAVLGLDPHFTIIEEVDQATALLRFAEESINECINDMQQQTAVNVMLELYGTDLLINGELAKCLITIYRRILERGSDFNEVRLLTAFTNKTEKLKELNEVYDAEVIAQLNAVENLVLNMVELMNQRYSTFKQANAVVDFNDLELLALKLLNNQAVRDCCRERYRFLLVDEFQDTNALQQQIIYTLVCDSSGQLEPQRLFVVGDHKQSIYGFRGTDYKIFQQVCNDIGADKIKPLTTCYRSLPKIINTINALFAELINPYEPLAIAAENEAKIGPPVELITYREALLPNSMRNAWEAVKQALKPGKTNEELNTALALVAAAEAGGSKTDQEAAILAGRIKRLNSEGFAYRDVAVLLRSRTNLAAYENALRQAGIPYCVLGGLGFFTKQEIIDLLNIYKFTIAPDDLIALVGALRSPAFALADTTITTLLQLLKAHGRTDLALFAQAAQQTVNAEQAARLLRANAILTKLCQAAGMLNAAALLREIINETNYAELLLTKQNGNQQYCNIEKLLVIAQEFDQKYYYLPREFPDYIDLLAEHAAGEGEAVLDTEDSDAVKILTIHAAKGLEFRAVIIPDLARDLTRQITFNRSKLIFNEAYGIVAIGKNSNEELKVEANPLYRIVHEQMLSREIEDAKRILYVAMTRAKEFLALIGKEEAVPAADKLHSFMKQVRYALAECGGIDAMLELDGDVFIDDAAVDGQLEIARIKKLLGKFGVATGTANMDRRLGWRYDGLPLLHSSISQYQLYRQCPRKYYLTVKAGLQHALPTAEAAEIDELDEREDFQSVLPLSGAARGTIVHAIIEKIVANGLTPEMVEQEIGNVIKANLPYLDENQLSKHYQEIRRYINAYYRIEMQLTALINGTLLKTYVELPFRLAITPQHNLIMQGVIDRIDVYDNNNTKTAVLIDYKTNRIQTPEDLARLTAHYTPQLQLYAAAAAHLLRQYGEKVAVKGAYLYYLDTGTLVEVAVTQGNQQACINDLIKAFTYIATHDQVNDYTMKQGDDCKSCSFAKLCNLI